MPTRSGLNYYNEEMSTSENTTVEVGERAGPTEEQNVDNVDRAEAETTIHNEENVEAAGEGARVPGLSLDSLNAQQLSLLIQREQLKLLEEQRRALELNIKERPMLGSLLPEDVNNFLNEWEVYKNTVKQMLGIDNPMLQQCIKISLMTELSALGADESDNASILEILTTLRNQDHEARKHFLVEKIKNDVEFINRGNVPASMRSYLLAVDKIKRGIKLDSHTEKLVCEAVLKNLPGEFLQGTVKETQSRRGWKKYIPMKKDLIEDAQILARYTRRSYEWVQQTLDLT